MMLLKRRFRQLVDSAALIIFHVLVLSAMWLSNLLSGSFREALLFMWESRGVERFLLLQRW
jgi:hypothetical protein